MTVIEKLGHDSPTDRTLFLLEVADPSDIPSISIESANFGVLLVWDTSEVQSSEMVSVGEKLISDGGSYFCCWGPGCESLHDAIDHAAPDFDDDDTVIMTTWHSDEPLEEALWFFINSAFPQEYFEETTKSMIVICVDNPDWASICRLALREPAKFSTLWLDRDESAV